MLEEYSLALEVGPSQVVQGERGLFVRVIGEDVEVSQSVLSYIHLCRYLYVRAYLRMCMYICTFQTSKIELNHPHTPKPKTQNPQQTQESTVEWGSILCGYGEGAMQPSPGESDKAVLFSLPTEEAAVFFNRELVPIFEVLAEMPDGTGLLGAFYFLWGGVCVGAWVLDVCVCS